MAFDVYESGIGTTLTGTTIVNTKDEEVTQDEAMRSHQRGDLGMLVVDWSVEQAGGSAASPLAAGTYDTGIKIPLGAVITGRVLQDCWEDAAGAGGATLSWGNVDGTSADHTLTLETSAATTALEDEAATTGFIPDSRFVADSKITVVTAGGTMTAGGWTMYIPYMLTRDAVSQIPIGSPVVQAG